MSTGQNGKGDRERNTGPRFKANYDHIFRKRYRIIQCESNWFIIPADEIATFCKWCLAKEGKRHMPAHFTPVEIESPEDITFEKWEESK